MPYSVKSKKNGTEYYLYSVRSANGKTRLYHFAKDANRRRQIRPNRTARRLRSFGELR